MKIGLVCPYNIFRGGGVQEVVLALQKELLTRGHEARIITPLPRDYTGPKSDHTIFIGTSADFKSPFHTTAQVSVSLNTEEIASMLEREQFDILHFHEPWVPIMSRQLLSRSKSKNLATFHAKLPETVMSRTIEKVITPYTRSVMKYLGELTAVSDAAAEYVLTLTHQPITIIPNGIDLDKYQNAKGKGQREKGVQTDKVLPKTILYIGRLEKRKGVKYLLKAFGLVVRKDPGIKLIIAGDGPDRVKLEDYARHNNISNVVFTGHVSEADKLLLLEEADLFCSPALYGESFGIVLLEAMAKGVVTVAGNNSGYVSVLQQLGELSIINPKDTTEFARRLHLLLYDKHLRSIWREWAQDYIKQFSYPKVVDQYESLYKKTLNTKNDSS